MSLYIETRIRADLDLIWDRTQDPAAHARWDLRFTGIDRLPTPAGEPQRFTYLVRVCPGLTVSGTGVNAGERWRPDGTRMSALRFVTGYDYRPRWGRIGRLVDRLAFRPLMGWGTAWSFDRLRLWCERGIPPGRALRAGLADGGVRVLAVLAAALVSPVLAVPAAAVALAVPVVPNAPSARRCRRRPPGPVAAPAVLDRLAAAR